MFEKKRFEAISRYYAPRLKDYSLDDYAILGWESRQAQESRFQVFTELADCRGKSILDVGCGLGNLYGYLRERNINCDYTGIDIIEEMVDRAAAKYDADFRRVDIFKKNPFGINEFDIIYSSGIFNIQLGNNERFLKRAVELFLEIGREKIIFNLLHESSCCKERVYWYTTEERVQTILSGVQFESCRISFNKRYLDNDFTVCIEKLPCGVFSA